MSVSVVVTNLSSDQVNLTELYVTLGAAGSDTDSVTVSRSVAQIDSMNGLKSLVDAGTVSVEPTQSTDNVDLLSVPLEQHGIAPVISVAAPGIGAPIPVAFSESFPTGVVPVVTLGVDRTAAPTAAYEVSVSAVTAAGFSIVVNVTGAAAETIDVHWTAVY